MKWLALTAGLFGAGVLLGCGSAEDDGAAGTGAVGGSGGAGATGGSGATGPTNCDQIGSSSTIPGLVISFPSQPCSFTLAEAAEGITIDYEVRVDSEIVGFSPSPQDFGSCDTPDLAGLIGFELLEGGGERYCRCDLGPCVATPFSTTVAAGTYPRQFEWDGRNWNGPSDTNRPKGEPFPAGSYTLEISTLGSVSGPTLEASAQFPITLVP